MKNKKSFLTRLLGTASLKLMQTLNVSVNVVGLYSGVGGGLV